MEVPAGRIRINLRVNSWCALSEKLPLQCYGTYHPSILEDGDFKRNIQLHLTKIAKKKYICAQDIVDYVAAPEVQQQLAHGTHV